mmetsp:Transcript_32732/g.91668  ORF Transcript_32732/g.91668 Transcript_32732/m.91668 type:complete len:602 (+) Transcript_32732:58-1863(+)|eukprot:CAMPEP_0119133658 /NCGR_PEP_ID=MMETSP1310-20130426/13488_1 /TAXON_ID=464262 /ORGANISM="Genus nov. species nov., Strain RCC2339" /LENGTH=601 /DNA_ID=CAMNT_0007124357 /DNA_START=53 /DNA_END=1858 /DNA_ORIENTATION=-
MASDNPYGDPNYGKGAQTPTYYNPQGSADFTYQYKSPSMTDAGAAPSRGSVAPEGHRRAPPPPGGVPPPSQQPSFGEPVPEPSPEELAADQEAQKRLSLAYRIIQTDPRYVRLCYKYDPNFFSKQKAKNLVDPKVLPVVGLVVKVNRTRRIIKNKAGLQAVSQSSMQDYGGPGGADAGAALAPSFEAMSVNMDAEGSKRKIGTALSVAFMMVPVKSIVPVSSLAASGLEKGAKKGAEKVGESSQLSRLDENSPEAQVHAKFLRTKAFLVYLGQPATDDELYSRWESSRIQVKRTYGALDEDDLAKMKPASALDKQLAEIEKQQDGVYNCRELGVSLLWLLWRVYECWHTIYYDYFKSKTKKSEAQYLTECRAKERSQDEEYIRNMEMGDHPFIRRALKSEKELVARFLVRTYASHPRSQFMGTIAPGKRAEVELWYWGLVADYFLDKQEVWAMVDPETLQFEALVLLEPVDGEPARVSAFGGASAMAKLVKKVGRKEATELASIKKEEYLVREQILKSRNGGFRTQVIHYGCFHPDDKDAFIELVHAVCNDRTDLSTATYVQEYETAPAFVACWEDCDFHQWCTKKKFVGLFYRCDPNDDD